MNEKPLALLPEILLLGGSVAGLLLGLFLPRRRQWAVALVAAAALVSAFVASAVAMAGPSETVWDGSYAVDTGLGVGRLVVTAAALLTLALTVEWARGRPRETEVYVLVLLASLGAVLLTGANDLMLLVAAYVLASVPLYALVGFAKDALGVEAVMKYYLMGALLGMVLLLGVTVLYGVAGGTTYTALARTLGDASVGAVAVGVVGVLAGLAFKAGAVPGHFWVPDVTAGAPPPVAAFVTTVPKVGALVALARLTQVALGDAPVDWPLLVALVAAASMTLGNLAAFFQDDPRRLLAYSTVSQVGYLLVAVAVVGRSDEALPALLYYLGAYAVTNLGAFAVVVELPRARTLTDFRGLFRRHPGLAVSLVVCLLGLVGTPPTAVFVGKLTVFAAGLDGRMAWLVVLAVVNTVASVFYYLRWIAPTFTREPDDARATALAPAGTWARAGAYAAAVATLALGLGAGPALDLADGALVAS